MKRPKFNYQVVLALLLLFITFSCAKQENKSSVEADIAAIKEVLNQYVVTCNNGDFDKWISLWSDNGIQMPPGAPSNIGKAKIIEAVKPAFDQMYVKITVTSLEEAKVYGNLGFTRCNYTEAVTPKQGGDTIVVVPDGKALTLYEKQSDGTWKILYDCFNSNTSPNVE